MVGIEPDADLATVYSTPIKWLMQKYPPLATPDGGPDPAAYHRIFDPLYRCAFDAGRQVRIVHARQLPWTHGGGRIASPGAGGPGSVHRRRRDPRLARRLRPRGRPPGARSAHRIRRPRGAGAAGTGAGTSG
ncbi:hypothetical protein GCM10027072_73220 [Streptomyces bullii]